MYSLAGINGNIYIMIAYTCLAMRECKFDEKVIENYLMECLTSTYPRLVVLSNEFLNKCNELI